MVSHVFDLYQHINGAEREKFICWFRPLKQARTHKKKETDGGRNSGATWLIFQQLFTWVKSYQCEIHLIQAHWLYVVLYRALLWLRGSLMVPLWMSWGLYCLSWTGTVWLWWTKELWLCGWRRWGVSAFLKRLWETLVHFSLRETYLGKATHLLEKTSHVLITCQQVDLKHINGYKHTRKNAWKGKLSKLSPVEFLLETKGGSISPE